METVWFCLIAVMLATYVVLDGFDFGAGILHLFVARNDAERRQVIASIGPVWDGNEVWIIAAGGVIVYAFPRAYAVGFSGFYLPLTMALWLLVLRGLSIEFRSKEANPLWRSFWDGTFFFASTLMAVILGAALGNLVRGVPVEPEGYFSGPLFTDFRVGAHPGVLDWYTVTVGVFALLALAGHGALYLNWKTTGPVQERARALAPRIWLAIIVAGVWTTVATALIRPELYRNLLARPVTWPLSLLVLASLVAVIVTVRQRKELPAFLSSACLLVSMLAASAAGVYPVILRSTLDESSTLTIFNATAGKQGLSVGLIWWSLAVLLAIGYFVYLFHAFRGKVTPESGGYH